MQNFLEETSGAIREAGLTADDIIFIGSEDTGHQCAWDEFCVLADFEYGDESGTTTIAADLIIAFIGGERLRRAVVGSFEWWEVLWPFQRPEENLPIKHLRGGGIFPTLETQNYDIYTPEGDERTK